MMNESMNVEGVEALDAKSLTEIQGGAWWPFVVVYILTEAAVNPQAHIKALVDGYNNAVK